MEDEKFYNFGDNTFHTRGFTWAYSIIPRSEVFRQVCPECGAIRDYPLGAFDVVVEGGTKYPDILGCGAYPFLILSGRVIDGWNDAGIRCYYTYPVGIAEVKSKKLMSVAPPRYFRVEIDGSCRIDLEASGIQVVSICGTCNRVIEDAASRLGRRGFKVVPGSWDGCAVFRDPIYYPRVTFCTEQVVQLAGQMRLTNFRFERMESCRDPSEGPIDYLRRR